MLDYYSPLIFIKDCKKLYDEYGDEILFHVRVISLMFSTVLLFFIIESYSFWLIPLGIFVLIYGWWLSLRMLNERCDEWKWN